MQRRHEERQQLLDATLSLGEAAQKYGVSYEVLRKRLDGLHCWQLGYRMRRYWIEDVERAVEGMRRL